MDEQTRHLVQTIAAQVIAALQQQGQISDPPAQSPGPAEPAPIRPPIGVCTGDYSKFPELAGRQVGAAPPDTATASTPTMALIPLSGIITASQLQDAMNASPDGVAALAPDARLTPLANDLVREHPEKICRTASPATTAISVSRTDAVNHPWLWWIEGQCVAVHELTAVRSSRLLSSGAANHPAALAQVVRDLAGAIRIRRVAGGLLFVHNAARAVCFANRCASIRAVVGTCGEAVEQGIAELGANVLVIEYPHQGKEAMQAMVDRIMRQPPKIPPTVQRELADLHRNG